MSAEAVGWVWKYSPMEKSGLLVHLAVADVTNDMHGNRLWCSTETLCQKTRLGQTAVREALDRLVAAGLLEEAVRPGRTTLYHFWMPELPLRVSDPLSGMPLRNLHGGVQNPRDTPPESAPELNRPQDDNPAPAMPFLDYVDHDEKPHSLATLRYDFKRRLGSK